MDAVEVARKAAAELHRQCAQSVDPTKPYLLALEAARRSGFDVNEVPVGSTHLDGGRAKLLSRDELIIHERAPTNFEKAFLVAHEIGHAKCGDDEEDLAASSIDPTRSAEQPRCAAEQIVDYGRRQRREVQMDLFAREFLLPRQLVRSLHLEKGLTASEIATLCQTPFAVVAQQLFDALLLPCVDEAAGKDGGEPTREDPDQTMAARHLGVPFLLEAGPGTGKTRTLVDRVEFLLGKGVDPRKILVLTFSNKAAFEMSDRIAARSKEAAVAMWMGTFHAFGLDIVRRFHTELGYAKDPRLLNFTEAVELLEPEFARLKLKHFRDLHDPTDQLGELVSAISRAKDEVTDAPTYAALAEAMREDAVTEVERLDAERACDVARAYEVYEALKRKVNCLDFGDLVYLPVTLLEGTPAIRERLRQRYEHILVDEYQDVNRSSVQLLTALSEGGNNLWVVGDPRQSIYRFRGASSFNVSRFGKEDFPGGIRCQLTVNYRSTPEIVSALSSFASEMAVGAPKIPYIAHRKSSGATLELRKCESPDSMIPFIADAIEEIHTKGFSYKDQAVLCSGNDTLAQVGAELERLGIPVLFLGSLFEREEIRHLLSLLSLLCDTRAAGLLHLGADKTFSLPISDAATIIDYLRANEKAPIRWMDDPALAATLSTCGRGAVSALAMVLRGFSSASQPWEVLAVYLLDRSRVAAETAQSTDVRVRSRGIAIWQFMNFIRVQPAAAGEPVPRLLIRVRRLFRLGDDTELREPPACAQALDAVRLTTIHRAKGLEFPAIHLVGVHDNPFPGWFRKPRCMPPDGMMVGAEHSSLSALEAGHKEERECLFYVGVSRARDHLRMYASAKNRGNASQRTSRYVERLGAGVSKPSLTTSRESPVLPEKMTVPLRSEGNLKLADYQLTQYARCPRDFFYRTIMQAGGKRTPTPFLQMHEAVRNVVEQILKGDENDPGHLLDSQFAANGLAKHGYAADYRAFALPMLEYLRDIRAGKKSMKTDPIVLQLGSESITVTPHELLEDEKGKQVLRSIRTGSQRSKSHDNHEAAALILAAMKSFPQADIELVFLNDRICLPLSMTPKVLRNRSDEMAEFFDAVKAGMFPPNPGDACARCAAFFYCGPLPIGELVRKF